FFATDNAGNVEGANTLTVSIDKTSPSITDARTPAANANEWNHTSVTITFECSDAFSGLAAGSAPQATVVSTQGAGQSVIGICSDLAGNSVSLTVPDIN